MKYSRLLKGVKPLNADESIVRVCARAPPCRGNKRKSLFLFYAVTLYEMSPYNFRVLFRVFFDVVRAGIGTVNVCYVPVTLIRSNVHG